MTKRTASDYHEPSNRYRDQRIATNSLLLDPYNPRLPPDEQGKTQDRIIEIMVERFAIAEIAESICSAGFLPHDPFIGYSDNSAIYILEGNRRLATIKLLLDPTLAPPRYKKSWQDFSARIANPTREAMSHINVRVYDDRRDPEVLAYIGYRHVNGVMSWAAEEKAAFIAKLLEDKKIRWSYAEIAQKLGSKPTYVEKLYVAHRLIEQARQHDVPGHDRMRTQFGVLTRALQAPGIVSFLGISFPRSPAKSREPSTKPVQELTDFVRWTFGTDKDEPIVAESRDLTKWGRILESTEAVRYLRTAQGPRFERAYAKSGGQKESLVDALMAAADYLAEALPLVRQHKQERDVERGVDRCADYLSQILAHLPAVGNKYGWKSNDSAG